MNEIIKLGLKGTVELQNHQKDWEINAIEVINQLKNLFGNVALDIQHIGSTSIEKIMAKPIIDIVVGVDNFDSLNNLLDIFSENNMVYVPFLPDDKVILIGNVEEKIWTHHIHVVIYNGENWNNYLNFRDYLNNNTEEAKNYEKIKLKLSDENKENREKYTKSKAKYILEILEKAREWRKIINNKSQP